MFSYVPSLNASFERDIHPVFQSTPTLSTPPFTPRPLHRRINRQAKLDSLTHRAAYQFHKLDNARVKKQQQRKDLSWLHRPDLGCTTLADQVEYPTDMIEGPSHAADTVRY